MIATDFDREGELIGLEALRGDRSTSTPSWLAARAPPTAAPVKRARYSALTKEEIERAFSELDELSYAARQRRRRPPGHRPDLGRDADPRRLARHPPLRLQLPLGRPRAEPDPGPDRRARARAPRPRRRALLGDLRQASRIPTAPSRPTTRPTSSGRRPRPRPRSTGTKSPGIVNEVTRAQATPASRRPRSTPPPSPPTPRAASGSPPPRAMRIAEDLYMDGFISYPRTDNTVYPASLPPRELVASLVKIQDFEAAAGPARRRAEADPRQEGDHRPPADLPDRRRSTRTPSRAPKRRVYELVVRRFLATFCPPMITESTRADIEAGSETYFVRGSVVVDPGLRRDLHLRPLGRRRDPEARGGPGARPRRRSLDRRQGDPAAVADLARAS